MSNCRLGEIVHLDGSLFVTHVAEILHYAVDVDVAGVVAGVVVAVESL